LKRATYEDVLNAPEHKVAEILDGELFLSPRPAPPHLVAASGLGGLLATFDRGPEGSGGWWILDEPEIHLGEDVVVPDISGWRRERLARMPETAYFSVPPDWVCEVLSPSTERIDRGRKLRIYAQAGVAHAWFVNPVERTLEVLRLRDGAWTIVAVHTGSDDVRAEPFDGIELPLGRLWIDPPRRASDPPLVE
jgi:Uma2 family endonuclease